MHTFEQTFSKFHNTFEQTFFYPSKVHRVFGFLDKLKLVQTKTCFKIPVSRFAAPLVKRERGRLQNFRDIRLEYDRGKIVIFYLAK